MNGPMDSIREAVRRGEVAYSLHSIEEMSEEGISFEEIRAAVLGPDAEIIESRADDPRGESHLVSGRTFEGRPLHVVLGVSRRQCTDLIFTRSDGKQTFVRGGVSHD